ncbi:MAG TPA: bacillithiol biosynthesis cysteine-adding enzyme BshC [Vicinamibacterales bacterium]
MTIPVSSSALRSAADIRRFPWIRRLAADYAYNFTALAPFFAGNPADPAAWPAAIARAQAHPRERDHVVAAIAAQQEQRGAPAAARMAARRLGDPAAVAIVTGQQAGLFGGPLFTLLKALTAIKLAARVSRDHGVPVVPVFWVESEDHDWDEVSSCPVLDAELRRETITLGTPPTAGQEPVASVRLDPSIFAAIEGLKAVLPGTDFTDALIEGLSKAYRPGASMSQAFGQWLESVLGHFGLVVYDSSEPATKALARRIFVQELQSPTETTRRARESGDALVALGYHAQVVSHEDNVALFRLDGVRQTIHFRDGHFVVGATDVPVGTLVAQAERQPEMFSPNVLLRPVVQDTLFPTICYVAGPNELAYLGQLKPVYERFSVPAPLMFPRASITLLDSAAAKFLARYDVALESLQPDDESTLNRLLESQLPRSVEAAFESTTRTVDSSMGALAAAVPSVDPTLEGATRSALGRMQHDLQALHGKIVQAAKRRDDTLRRQFARTRAQAFPGGHPQERSVGFVYFLNRYGPALVDRLHEELPLDLGKHWIMTI